MGAGRGRRCISGVEGSRTAGPLPVRVTMGMEAGDGRSGSWGVECLQCPYINVFPPRAAWKHRQRLGDVIFVEPQQRLLHCGNETSQITFIEPAHCS